MEIPTLENEIVRLMPLTIENFKKLITISAEKDLLRYSPSSIETFPKLKDYVQNALDLAAADACIPFIIFDKRVNRYAGCTRFGNIDEKNKVIHIGWTWIGREFQGTGLNTAVKYLMINYAFRTMKMEKIEFRIDDRNIRSRKAVEKLGAKLEGILRKNVYLPDGYKRNTCCYGILKEEWFR
ncbi:GNAT family N-acetyltransferase [Robertkochia solimangrovi]|uniref:GNAT family N-acetyltransferase n=1 Tax=Robertkochia solimangrovi TaxID=2213046 RepID=UPI00117F3706|nr:GNAT family protein [Robertkochia solimangrovi]TRZ42618.1 N-acetyltransferase [Robertkochia solimangrovi]